MLLLDLLQVTINGVRTIALRSWQWLLRQWRRITAPERIYLGIMLVSSAFLIQEWRSYDIMFSETYQRNHNIYSDDFLLFVILLGISILPTLIHFADDETKIKHQKAATALRLSGLAASSVLYLLNLAFPSRIAATDEASFTWQFFVFGTCLTASWLFGYKGIIAYAQYPSRS